MLRARWLVVPVIAAAAIGIWAMFRGSEIAVVRASKEVVRSVAWSADGSTIVTGGDDRTVCLWDANGYKLRTRLTGHTGKVLSVAAAAKAPIAASTGEDGTVRLWELPSGTAMAVLEGSGKLLAAVALSPGGSLVAAAGADRKVHLWTTANGKPAKSLEGHTKRILALDFSRDGRHLASVGEDEKLRIWDTATGTLASTIPLGHHRGLSLAFSHDDRFLACALNGSGVRIWEYPSLKEIALAEPLGLARSVAFGPNANTLITAHEDSQIRVQSPTDGTAAIRCGGHRGIALGATASPDGGRIASVGGDGTLRIWPGRK